MNLEALEERCLRYLAQVSTPLVPIDTLLAHIRQSPDLGEVSASDLLGFLRKHELVMVVDPSDAADSRSITAAREAGFAAGPRVILKARVPRKSELDLQLNSEMDRLTEALGNALNAAKQQGDSEKVREIMKVLARAQSLRERLNEQSTESPDQRQ